MTQELIARLRGKHLKCECHASCRGECCCSTDWPESFCDEAADALERLTAERDAIQAALDGAKLFEQSHRHALTVIDRLESERNAYQLAADKMAMEHKVERDGLGAQVDALEKDAARYRKLCEILQMAYDSQSFDSERLTIYCEQLSGWRNERTVEARVTWIDARDADLDLSSAIDAAIKEHGNDQ